DAEGAEALRPSPYADRYRPFVIVALGALPPDPAPRAPGDVRGSEGSVLGGVPLARDLGRPHRQGGGARYPPPRAEGTPLAPVPFGQGGLPYVVAPAWAPPPHTPARAPDHIARPERSVLGGVPLGRERRRDGREPVGDADPAACTERAARASRSPI